MTFPRGRHNSRNWPDPMRSASRRCLHRPPSLNRFYSVPSLPLLSKTEFYMIILSPTNHEKLQTFPSPSMGEGEGGGSHCLIPHFNPLLQGGRIFLDYLFLVCFCFLFCF